MNNGYNDLFGSVVNNTTSELEALLKTIIEREGDDGEVWFGEHCGGFTMNEIHYSPISLRIDDDGDIMIEFVCNGLSMTNYAVQYGISDMCLYFLLEVCEFICDNV